MSCIIIINSEVIIIIIMISIVGDCDNVGGLVMKRCQCLYRIIVATINWLPPALHCFDPPVNHVARCIVCHCLYVHPPGNFGSDFLGPVFPLHCFVCHCQKFLPLSNSWFSSRSSIRFCKSFSRAFSWLISSIKCSWYSISSGLLIGFQKKWKVLV